MWSGRGNAHGGEGEVAKSLIVLDVVLGARLIRHGRLREMNA